MAEACFLPPLHLRAHARGKFGGGDISFLAQTLPDLGKGAAARLLTPSMTSFNRTLAR